MPEVGDAAWAGFNPVRRRDRLAALGAGIALRQTGKICSGHGASPFAFDAEGLVFEVNRTGLLSDTNAHRCVNHPPAMSLLNGDTTCPRRGSALRDAHYYSRIPMRSRMGDARQVTGSTFEAQCLSRFPDRSASCRQAGSTSFDKGVSDILDTGPARKAADRPSLPENQAFGSPSHLSCNSQKRSKTIRRFLGQTRFRLPTGASQEGDHHVDRQRRAGAGATL
jgi:hypothetical protein